MDKQSLHILFEKYLQQGISAQEEALLLQLLADPANKAELNQVLEGHYEKTLPGKDLAPGDIEAVFEDIIRTTTNTTALKPVNTNTGHRRIYTRLLYVAAACVAVLIAGALYFKYVPGRKTTTDIAVLAPSEVKPGTNKAVLTLADGKQLTLDEHVGGALAEQAGVQIIKTEDGQVIYKGNSLPANAVTYNTLTTPRGGQYQLTLQDGTKVWLNASSSLRYPAAFSGKERKVSVSGEVYFEVSKDASKPFIVETNDGAQVEVLGTSFNINAYHDEPVKKTTLLEGSIRITNNGKEELLVPGEQWQLAGNGRITVEKGINTENVIAWKNGLFVLQGADLAAIVRQISRWYDVEVVVEGAVPDKTFGGVISRDINLEDMLNALKIYRISSYVKDTKLIIKFP